MLQQVKAGSFTDRGPATGGCTRGNPAEAEARDRAIQGRSQYPAEWNYPLDPVGTPHRVKPQDDIGLPRHDSIIVIPAKAGIHCPDAAESGPERPADFPGRIIHAVGMDAGSEAGMTGVVTDGSGAGMTGVVTNASGAGLTRVVADGPEAGMTGVVTDGPEAGMTEPGGGR